MKNIMKICTAVLLAFAMLAASGCGKENPPPPEDDTTTAADVQQENALAQTQPQETGTDAVIEDITLETQLSEEDFTAEETTAAEAVPESVEDIVSLFNTSANKIKTDAVKVVKNYEKRTVNEEHVSIPRAIEGFAKSMLKTFMKDDVDPIVYDTKEEIRTEYLVPDQSYVSRMTAADVAHAICTDKGSTYEIYIKLKTSVDPRAGIGVGSVCDVIETYEVEEGADFVEEFSTEYYNCEIRATIDKATGRMTRTNYKTPLVLRMVVDVLGTHSGSIGLTFEKDYTITY